MTPNEPNLNRNERKFIRKSSYSALRLYNEIPSQIDQETRILFVGPIPIEWLLVNNRSWSHSSGMRRMFPKVYSRLWSDAGSGGDGRRNDGMSRIMSNGSALNNSFVAGPEGVYRAVNDLIIAPNEADEESLLDLGQGILSEQGQLGRIDEYGGEEEEHDDDDDDDRMLSRYLTTEEATSTLLALPVISDDYDSEGNYQHYDHDGYSPTHVSPHSLSPTTSVYSNRGIISDGDSKISPSPRSTSYLLANDSTPSELSLGKSDPTPIFGTTGAGSSSKAPFSGLDASVSTMASSMQSYFTARESMGSIDSRASVESGLDGSETNSSANSIDSNQSNEESSASTIKAKSPPPVVGAGVISAVGAMAGEATTAAAVRAGIRGSVDSGGSVANTSTSGEIGSNASHGIILNSTNADADGNSHTGTHRTSNTSIPTKHTRTSTLETIKGISPDARSYLSEILQKDTNMRNPSTNPSIDTSVNTSINHNTNHNIPIQRFGTDLTTSSTRSKITNKLLRASAKPITAGRKVKREYRKHKKSFVISTDKILRAKKTGEVVMIEKILVMVKSVPGDKIIPSSFNEMEQIDTRTVQRWKEFVVVARKSGIPDAPVYLQFYKSRHIAKVEDSEGVEIKRTGAHSNRPALSVAIGKDFEVNLYSSLDKSIVLWNKEFFRSEGSNKKNNLIYILRARSEISAMNWLSFLASIVGITAESHLTVNVPDLGVSVDVEIPFHNISVINELEEQSNFLSLKQITKHSSAPSWLGAYIVEKCLDAMYEVEPIRKQIDENWRGIVKAGLAWRKYDRIEWMFDLHGSQIRSSWAMMKAHHELELRPKVPFSLPVIIKGETIPLPEPFPIEGFVIRLNSWQGEIRKQKLLNRSYFHTHDNLLFYSRPIKALPPFVGEANAIGREGTDRNAALLAGLDLINEIAPYKTDEDGNIEWLDKINSIEEFDKYDLSAQYEMKRRISLISRSEGFIDLTELKEINACEQNPNRFQLVFKSSTILEFQVHNIETRNIWVNQLKNLMIYWKNRKREEVNRTNAVRQQNLEILHIDEDAEAFVGEAASKWETDRGIADPITYNIAGISCSRSLFMKGLLFQKPSKFSTFRRYYVVLSLTDLILYIPSPSSVNNQSENTELRVNYYKVQSVSLSECYVYSGPLTNSDLLDREKTFDKDNPGRHALPRAYSDGWKSAEEENLRCFVLWFGKKSYAASSRKDKKLSIKTVNRLGVGGTSMVFMARSRHDRDLWVTALNTVMSRLAVDSHEDIVLL